MLGIYIHNMKDVNSKTDIKGTNPLSNWHVERDGKKVLLSDIYPTYDWINDDGYKNLGTWIEAAAKRPANSAIKGVERCPFFEFRRRELQVRKCAPMSAKARLRS
jgi:hypothetical protein